MRYQELLTEYINYDKEKFISKWKAEGLPFTDDLSNGEFASWLEQYDPTPGNKYVNWMIVRYLKDDIRRYSKSNCTCTRYIYAFRKKKKLKPEHKDLGKITNIEDVIDEYKSDEVDLSSKSEVEDNFYKSGDAELVYNDSGEYKVVIPKTEEASKYFGKNTRWCTAAENNNMFSDYANDGSLYIILQKATNKRWQFHFLSGQYMDEQDRSIKLGEFLINHKKIFSLFKNIGCLSIPSKESGAAYITNDIPNNGVYYYDSNDKNHREDGPAMSDINGKQWMIHGELHREDGPAIIDSFTKQWLQHDKMHRLDGPAYISGDGHKEWWINDHRYSEYRYNYVLKQQGYKV